MLEVLNVEVGKGHKNQRLRHDNKKEWKIYNKEEVQISIYFFMYIYPEATEDSFPYHNIC